MAVHYLKYLLISRNKTNQPPQTSYSAEPDNKQKKRVAHERRLTGWKSWPRRKKACAGPLRAAGVSRRGQNGLGPQEPGRWHAAGCIHHVLGSRERMSTGMHHPVTPQPSQSSQRRRCGIIICQFSGVHCWDCNPSIASQGEITLEVKSAENSQVTCSWIRYRKGKQSPEVSRLEGVFCYGQAQTSEVFYLCHSLMPFATDV